MKKRFVSFFLAAGSVAPRPSRRPTVKLGRLICWCLIVIVPLSAWPQSQSGQPAGVEDHKEKLSQGEGASKVKTQVQERGTGEKARVKITLRDKTEVKGYISQIDADSFQVTDKKTGKVSTVTYDAVARVRGGGLSRGAKIAIWVGVGAALAIGLWIMAHTLNHS
jgi:hypothetical protein